MTYIIDSKESVVCCTSCNWKGPVKEMPLKDRGMGLSSRLCPTCGSVLTNADWDDEVLVTKNAAFAAQ